jgi:hypothetical protein
VRGRPSSPDFGLSARSRPRLLLLRVLTLGHHICDDGRQLFLETDKNRWEDVGTNRVVLTDSVSGQRSRLGKRLQSEWHHNATTCRSSRSGAQRIANRDCCADNDGRIAYRCRGSRVGVLDRVAVTTSEEEVWHRRLHALRRRYEAQATEELRTSK